METVILGWYVMVQTGSVLLLTAFGSLLLLGTLVSPMFGVLGDRLGGRVMLCVMRAIYTVLAAFVLLLTLTGSLAPVWVFVVATLAGIVRPNDQVMRNALIGETILPAHLMGAVGLSRATMDSARVAGALAGAALSTILGIGPTYVLVTSFYATSLALTFGVARRPLVPDPGGTPRAVSAVVSIAVPTSSRRRDLKDGLLHVLLAGFVQSVAMIAMTANLIAASDVRFRGRVMGVRTLAIYGMPLGLMTSGALIERIGYPLTISAFSAVGLLFTLLIGIKWRASLWQQRAQYDLDTAPHSRVGSG